jgi:hypothetical protein
LSAGDVLEPVRHAPPGQTPEPFERQRRASRVPQESLATEIIARRDPHARMQVECVVKAKEEPMT